VFWFGLFVPNMDPRVRRPLEDMDLFGYFLPKLWYGNQALLAGELPAWNPWEFAGLPLLGAAQPAVLYPPKMLVFALVPVLALHAFMVLHYVLAGVFAYAAFSGLGLGWAGAVLATVTWVFSAVNMDSHYHVIRLACLVWVPLVFLWFVRTVERPGPRPAAALALVAALAVLAGYPEYALDTGIALLVFWPLAARAGALSGPGLGLSARWILVSALVAGAVAALQVLPLAELMAESARVTTRPFMLDLIAFWGWNFLRDPKALRIVLGQVAHAFHMAPAVWVLVLVGLVLGRGRFRLPFGVLFFLMIAFATVLGRLLRSVPGLSLLRPTYCWISLAYLPAAYLAGSGLETLLGAFPAEGARRRLGKLALLGTAVAASATFFAPRSWPWLAAAAACLALARTASRWRTPALLGLVAAVVLAVWAWNPPVFTTPVVHRYARLESPYPGSPPRPSGLATDLARLCGPERQRFFAPGRNWDGTAVVDRVELVQGYPESLVPARMQHLLTSRGLNPEQSIAIDPGRMVGASTWLDMLNVGCVVAPETQAFEPGPGLDFVAVGRTGRGERVFRRPSALPRAFVVEHATAVGTREAAFAGITRADFWPAREAYVEAPADALPPPGAGGTVRLTAWEPEELRLAVSAPRPVLVVVSQAYFPGWQARVDGARVPVYPADYVLLGIPVPAGDHEVVLAYRPLSVRAGAVLSAVGVAALLGLAVLGRKRP
jgi:hypothetical protein